MDNLECVHQPKQLLTGMVELVVVHNSALVPGIKHCTVSAPHLSGIACIQLLVCLPACSDQSSQAGADELSTQPNPVKLRQPMANIYI